MGRKNRIATPGNGTELAAGGAARMVLAKLEPSERDEVLANARAITQAKRQVGLMIGGSNQYWAALRAKYGWGQDSIDYRPETGEVFAAPKDGVKRV